MFFAAIFYIMVYNNYKVFVRGDKKGRRSQLTVTEAEQAIPRISEPTP
jgi:hypothetical protein